MKKHIAVLSNSQACSEHAKNKLIQRTKMYEQIITPISVCVEVGVHIGDNARLILQYRPKHLYLVDWWRHPNKHGIDWLTLYQQAYTVCRNYPYNTTVIRGDSLEVAKQFPDEYFDVVYIDAEHKSPEFDQDIKAWFPKVKIDGYFCGDDYIRYPKHKYTVIEVIDKFIKENSKSIEIVYSDEEKIFGLGGQYCFKKLNA